MADKSKTTALSILLRLVAALLALALGGGLAIDYVAQANPEWRAKAQLFGTHAARQYLNALVDFEKRQ